MTAPDQVVCNICNEEVASSQIVQSAQGEICAACEGDLDNQNMSLMDKIEANRKAPKSAVVGLLVMSVPFLVNISTSTSDMTGTYVFSYDSLIGGVLGMILTVVAVFQTDLEQAESKPTTVSILIIMALLAVYHLATVGDLQALGIH